MSDKSSFIRNYLRFSPKSTAEQVEEPAKTAGHKPRTPSIDFSKPSSVRSNSISSNSISSVKNSFLTSQTTDEFRYEFPSLQTAKAFQQKKPIVRQVSPVDNRFPLSPEKLEFSPRPLSPPAFNLLDPEPTFSSFSDLPPLESKMSDNEGHVSDAGEDTTTFARNKTVTKGLRMKLMGNERKNNSRTPVNMVEIHEGFRKILTDAKVFNMKTMQDWYVTYVMGAKELKEAMLKRNPIVIAGPEDDDLLYIYRGKSKNNTIRTDVSKRIFTYNAFLACITISIARNLSSVPSSEEERMENFPPAPLAANIKSTNPRYKAEMWWIHGHGGIAAVCNYFVNLWRATLEGAKTDEEKEAAKKKVFAAMIPIGHLVKMAQLMDDQSKGDIVDGTLKAISSTCGVSSAVLMTGGNPEEWNAESSSNQRDITATELKAALGGRKKSDPLTASGSNSRKGKNKNSLLGSGGME